MDTDSSSDDENVESESLSNSIYSHFQALSVLKSYGNGQLSSEIVISSLGTSAFLKETIHSGLELSSIMTQHKITGRCSRYRTEYTWVELQFLPFHTIASYIYGYKYPHTLLDLSTLHDVRMLIVMRIYKNNISNEGLQNLMKDLMRNFNRSVIEHIRHDTDLSQLIRDVIPKYFFDAELASMYKSLSYTAEKHFRSYEKFSTREICFNALLSLKDIRDNPVNSSFINKVNSVPDERFHASNMIAEVPEEFIKRESAPYLSDVNSVVVNYIKTANPGPGFTDLLPEDGVKTKRMLEKHFPGLDLPRPESWIALAEIIVMKYAIMLTESADDEPEPVVSAMLKLRDSLSPDTLTYFNTKSNIENCLTTLSGVMSSNYSDASDVENMCRSINLMEPGEAMILGILRLKGVIFEIVACDNYNLPYRTEKLKPSLEVIIREIWGEEAMTTLYLDNATKYSSSRIPDNYRIYSVDDVMYDTKMRMVNDYVTSPDNRQYFSTTLKTMTYSETSSFSGTSSEDTISDSCEIVEIPKVSYEGKPILEVFEFGWVYDVGGKRRKDTEKWVQTICSLLLSGYPIILTLDIVSTGHSMWKVGHLEQVRRLMSSLQSNSELAAGPMLTYNINIDRPFWHHEKTLRKMQHARPPNLEKQIEGAKKRLKDQLYEIEEVMYEDDVEELMASLDDSKHRVWNDQISVEEGVQFLASASKTSIMRCKLSMINKNSLKEFECGFKDENGEVNPGCNPSRNSTVENILFNGRLSEEMWKKTAESPVSSALDKIMSITYPCRTSKEKIFKRFMNCMSLRLAFLAGCSLVSKKDGNLEITDRQDNTRFGYLARKILPDRHTFNEEEFEESSPETSEYIADKIKSLIRLYMSESDDISSTVHYCKRDPAVLIQLKNEDKGILRPRADVLKRKLIKRIQPKFRSGDRFRKITMRGHTPTLEECTSALDKMRFSMIVTEENIENYKNLLAEPTVMEVLSNSGFTNISREVFTRAVHMLTSVLLFQRMLVLQEVSRCFLSLYKRKKSNMIIETRVRSTNGRLYLKRQRNYREVFEIAYVNDDGTGYFSMRMNQKLAMLAYSLPSMIVSIFIMNYQEQLVSRQLTTTRLERLFTSAVSDVEDTIKLQIEDSYNEPGSTLPSEPETAGLSDDERCVRGLVGLLYTSVFRLHPSQENNTIASMSRYAIMYNWSVMADSAGLGKKICGVVTNTWDYIELSLIRYMFKLKFLSIESYRNPPCYHIGFQVPHNHNVAVSCMYYHHMYVRLLGERNHANNKAHASYLEPEFLLRETLSSDDYPFSSVSGNDGLYELFYEWKSTNDYVRKLVLEQEAANILQSNMLLPNKRLALSRFVVDLAAANMRNSLGSPAFYGLSTSPHLNKTLTQICEPNSVVKTFRKTGTIETIVDAVVGDMDKSVQNSRTDYAIERSKQLFTSDDSIKELISNNPAFKRLLDDINRVIELDSDIYLNKFVNEEGLKHNHFCQYINMNKLTLIKLHKKMSSSKIRELKMLIRENSFDADWITDDSDYRTSNTLLVMEPLDIYRMLEIKGVKTNFDDLKIAEEKCSEFIKLLKVYIKTTQTVPDVNRVDIKSRLIQLEEEINKRVDLLMVAYLSLIYRVTFSRLYLYEWKKKRNHSSIASKDVKISERQLKTLIKPYVNISEYVARVVVCGKRLVDAISSKEDVLSAGTLDSLTEKLVSLLGLLKTREVFSVFIHGTVEMMLRPTSYVLKKYGLPSSSAYGSARSTSLELMGSIMQTFNDTSLFHVAMRILSSGFEYKLGVAPKAQMMGVRELGILEINTKIVMAFFESVMGHLLKHIESDLLENPRRKDEILKQAGQWMRSQKLGQCKVLCTSGDRSKWAQKHSYLGFYMFFSVLFDKDPFIPPLQLICLEGMMKKLEIPVSSINATMKALLNLTWKKREALETLKKLFCKLFNKLSSMTLDQWNMYKSIGDEIGLMEYIEAMEYENSEQITSLFDTEFDWADELGSENSVFMSRFLCLNLTDTQLHVCHMLSQGRLYTTLFSHMIQGIPHRASSILHNSLLSLSVKVYKEATKLEQWSEVSEIAFVTSSDDYFLMQQFPSETPMDECHRQYMKLMNIQNVLCGSASILDSPKTLVSSNVAEVYSSFETGDRTNIPLIKLVQNHLSGEQTTPLQHNLEESTKINQYVDFSATECDLYAYLTLKHSRVKESVGIKEDMFNVIRHCCGAVNPFLTVSYYGALSQNTDSTLLNNCWYNYNWFKRHYQLSKGNISVLAQSLLADQTYSASEKLCRLTALILDGVMLDPTTGRAGKVETGTRARDITKLKEPFCMPYSAKLKNQREKLRDAKPEMGLHDQAFRMTSRGGLTNIVSVEESRIVQALTSPKLEIKMSRIFEDSGYSMLRYFLNSHCVVLSPECGITKYMDSWLKHSNGDKNVDQISRTKFRFSDIVSVCLNIAAALITVPKGGVIELNDLNKSMIQHLRKSKVIKEVKATKLASTSERNDKLSTIQEREEETTVSPVDDDSILSSGREQDRQSFVASEVFQTEDLDDRPFIVKKRTKKRKRRNPVAGPSDTMAAGEVMNPQKVIDWVKLADFEFSNDEDTQHNGATSDMGDSIESDGTEAGGGEQDGNDDGKIRLTDSIDPAVLKEPISVTELEKLLERICTNCEESLTTLDVGVMQFNAVNRSPVVSDRRRLDPGETIIIPNVHYNQTKPTSLVNNWALVAVHILYRDVVKGLELPYTEYSALFRDEANVVSKVGQPPTNESDFMEYFSRVEAAFSNPLNASRKSYIRASSRDSTLYGSHRVHALSRNICDGWLMDILLNTEGIKQEEGEASAICQSISAMSSKCDLSGAGSNNLVSKLVKIVDNMRIIGDKTMRDLNSSYISYKTNTPLDLVNMNIICSSEASTVTDVNVVRLCESTLLNQKALVATDGNEYASIIQGEGVLILTNNSMLVIKTLLARLWEEIFGFAYPRTDVDRGNIASLLKMTDKAKEILYLPKLFIRMLKDGSYRLVQPDSSTSADIECFLDSSKPNLRAAMRGSLLVDYTHILTAGEGGIGFSHTYENIEMSAKFNDIRLQLLRLRLMDKTSEDMREILTESAKDPDLKKLTFKTNMVKARNEVMLTTILSVLNHSNFSWPKERRVSNSLSLLDHLSKKLFTKDSSLTHHHSEVLNFVNSIRKGPKAATIPKVVCTKVSRLVCKVAKELGSQAPQTGTKKISGSKLLREVGDRCLLLFEELLKENSTIYKHIFCVCFGLVNKPPTRIAVELVRTCPHHGDNVDRLERVKSSDISQVVEQDVVYIEEDDEYHIRAVTEDGRDNWMINCVSLVSMIITHLNNFGPMTVPVELKHANCTILSNDIQASSGSITVSPVTYNKLTQCISNLPGERHRGRVKCSSEQTMLNILRHLYNCCYMDMSTEDVQQDITEAEVRYNKRHKLPEHQRPVSKRGWPIGKLWKRSDLASKCSLSLHLLGGMDITRRDQLTDHWLKGEQVLLQEPSQVRQLDKLLKDKEIVRIKLMTAQPGGSYHTRLVDRMREVEKELSKFTSPESEVNEEAKIILSVLEDLE